MPGTPPPTNADATLDAALGKITARIPTFWPSQPELWFHQLEAQFQLSRITSEVVKYRWVIGNLEAKYANEIFDLIQTPPSENPYSTIRTALIQRLTDSPQVRLHKLLAGEELGDRQPSQVLRHLKALDPTVPDDVVKTVWLDHLPESIKPVVVSQTTLTLEQLGKMADSVYEVLGSVRIAQISKQSTIQTTPVVQSSSLEHRVEELSRQVALLSTRFQPSRNQNYRSHSRSRNHFTRNDNNRDNLNNNNNNDNFRKLCWFHTRYGSRAKRCSGSCDWTGQDARNAPGNFDQGR